MSSFLCFICHSTVNADTNEDLREKYREVVGMNLCMDSHLCHICCHVLNKLWLFRAVCLKRSLEYPVLFSEKGTINLQRNELELVTVCTEECQPYRNRRVYSNCGTFHCEHTVTSLDGLHNEYLTDEYFQQDEIIQNKETELTETNDHEYFDYQSKTQVHSKNCEVSVTEELNGGKFVAEELNGEESLAEESIAGELNSEEIGFNEEHENEVTPYENEEQVNENLFKNDTFHNFETQNVDLISNTEIEIKTKNKKSKKSKKKSYKKITLSLEEQKKELERRRKEKKYIEAEFKCFSCGLGFLFKYTYQTHMMRHEESNGEHRCIVCSLRFASLRVLRSHSATHKDRYLCLKCTTTVLPRARQTHAKKCWKGRVDVASCHLCGAIFSDSSGLQRHLKRFHQTKASTRTYACNICGQRYNNQAAVQTHMIKHINRKFDCDQCPARFSSPYTLTQHKKKHKNTSELQVHRCEICDVSYSSRKSLLAHKRNANNHQQTFFECPICSRQCPNQRSLASHIEAIHSGVKQHECPQCTARYSNRKSLVRHISSHNKKFEVKKVICHLCGASFKGNNKLNRHLREVCYRKHMEEIGYVQDCMDPT